MNKYSNILLINNIPGGKFHSICTCGQESREKMLQCPICKTKIIDEKSYIQFGNIPFTSSTYAIDNLSNKDLYRFVITYSFKSGNYRINFSKQKIYKVNVENNHIANIIFDGHAQKKDMIKYYDNEDGYMSKKDFLEKYKYYSYFISLSAINVRKGSYLQDENYSNINNAIRTLEKLRNWCSEPYNEILIKANIDPNLIPMHYINKEGTTPMEILNLKKYSVKQLAKYNDIECYTTIKNLEERLGDKAVPYMDKFVMKNENVWLKSDDNTNKMITLINEANLSIEKLYKYIYKEASVNQYLYSEFQVVNLLYDSFEMCKQLGLKFDKAPKSLVRYHDTLAREISTIQNVTYDNKIQSVVEKYRYLQDISEKDDEDKFKNKYSIILPKDSKDIIVEGKKMGHCVGSYVARMANEECVILFVRASEFINQPYVTMEFRPSANAIVQIKGAHNSKPVYEVLEYIKKWAKNKNIKISAYY